MRPVLLLLPFLALTAPVIAVAATTAPATTAERVSDTWDLSPVYPSVAAWEADLARANTALDALSTCKGKLATSLRPCLEQRFDAQKLAARIMTYAGNLSNADTRDATWQARSQQADMLATEFGEATSFFRPEILTLGGAAVEQAIAADPGLAPFDHYLRSTIKDAPHTLDAAGETLLAGAGNVLAAPGRTESLLLNAELPWPSITLSDGTSVQLTPATYTNVRASSVRADRTLVFNTFFGALHAYEGVLGSLLDGSVSGDWMIAKARRYDTSVAASIGADHVPTAVYDTLVARTNANLPTLHRYLKLRARMLNLSDLAYSDLYPPLVALDRHWTVDEAKALMLAATKPLGTEYTTTVQAGFDARWMDVYPRPGKRGGAYMDGGAYEVHPYLLLNYTGDYESVSTLAHEWGHALHSVLAAKAQPYAKSDYATFTAEIASTFNEALLLQEMLKNARDDDERLYYLGSNLEGLRTTYFRQAQFAEFELAIHKQVEQGQPLTGASMTATYLDILKRYYGADAGVTRVDDLYGIEWAYIPHFYNAFYVYQYATSIAASSLLAEDVLAKKKGALDRYLGLLKAGGSDDPYVLLQKAGVDMATPAPYDALARRMNTIMDEMEAILERKASGKSGKGGKGKKP